MSTSGRINDTLSEPESEAQQERDKDLDRLVFFSDAIFAIAITLLALEIRLPELPANISNAELLNQLLAIGPKYYSFAISFLAIGLYWLGHHHMFQFIVRYDAILLFLNLMLLMCIVFIPFPSAVIGDFANGTATVFYALTLTVTGLLSGIINLYANQGGRLLAHPMDRRSFIFNQFRTFFPPVLFFLSAGVALVNPLLARIPWYLIALATFIINFLDQQRGQKKRMRH